MATATVNWIKYASLRSTYAYDLGFFHNIAFNQALGRDTAYLFAASWFSPGDHDGPSVYRSNHFSPMRLILLPQVYRLWPHMATFLTLHSLMIGAGAAALYYLGTRRTGRTWIGLLLAGSYLAHPAVLHMAFNDFREIQLGVAPALFALAFHAEGRRVPFLAAALLMLACRGEYAFLLACFGPLNWRLTATGKRDPFWWGAPLLLAVAWLLLAGLYYHAAYGVFFPWGAKLGATASGGALFTLVERLPAFLRTMLLPAALGVLTPEAFAVALPFVAGAASVRWPAFPPHDLQHLSPALVATFWAFAATVVRYAPRLLAMRARTVWASAILGAVTLAACVQFAAATLQAYVLGGAPRYDALARLDAALPADATALVPKRLAARFSAHARVLTYEALPLEAGAGLSREAWLGALSEVLGACDLVATERQAWLDRLILASGRFAPPLPTDGVHVFLPRPEARRSPDPDGDLQRALRWSEMPSFRRRWATIRVDAASPSPARASGDGLGARSPASARTPYGPT
jgi:hypothetical protein